MATIVTRAGKGSALSHEEVDANFNNLNNDKAEAARLVSAGTGLTGGGSLAADRTLELSAPSIASLVLADSSVQPARLVSAGTGLTGGGSLAADRTLELSAGTLASLALADTSAYVGRLISAGTGLTGGGSLAADRTIALSAGSIASLALADSSVQPARLVSAGTGLTGGGSLAADRTLALSAGTIASLALADASVQAARLVSAGTGLTGGGSLASDRTISLSAGSIASLALADSSIQPARLVSAGTGLTGGGSLAADRTLAADLADQSTAETGTSNTKLMTPLRTKQLIDKLPPGIPVVTKAAGTLVSGDNGYVVSSSSGTWVLNTGLPSGTAISLFNNSGSTRSLTQGGGVTLRLLGGSTTGSRTLSAYGLATLMHFGSEVWGITGAGVS